MFRNIRHLGDKVLEGQSGLDVGYCQWRGRGPRVLRRYVPVSLIDLFLLEFYLAIYVLLFMSSRLHVSNSLIGLF